MGYHALTPFSQLDYPGQLAAIVWFAGCSLRCSYCYNPDIITETNSTSRKELFAFLKKRKGMLDAVVLSGGECTSSESIIEIARTIKDMGYLIKVDTNGMEPAKLAQLLEEKLIDRIALDYKAPANKFKEITESDNFEKFRQSLSTLLNQNEVEFEVRTTVHTDLLTHDDLQAIIDDLVDQGYTGTYYLQEYRNDAITLGSLTPSTKPLMIETLSAPFPIEVRKTN